MLNKNKDRTLEKVKKIERKGPSEIRKKLLSGEALNKQLLERKKT